MNSKITNYKLIIFFISIIILSIVLVFFSIINTNINCADCNFVIYENETVSDVAHRLDSLGYVDNYYSFIITSKFLSKEKMLKPGDYDLSNINNITELINYFTEGRYTNIDYIKVTIPEGWSINQIKQRLVSYDLIDSNIFESLCYDSLFIESLGFKNTASLEGYLFPETYFFLPEKNEKKIIQKMTSQFNKIMNHDELISYKDKFNNINELITLASIIQGEAGNESEMSKISSVFNNRLNENMRLGADITIKYVINKDRMLIDKDFKFEENDTIKNHPYNTYTQEGLPPGPINNPGFSAIKAAIYPDSTDYLFFVLKSKNSREHVFSKTKEEHDIAREKYMDSKRK